MARKYVIERAIFMESATVAPVWSWHGEPERWEYDDIVEAAEKWDEVSGPVEAERFFAETLDEAEQLLYDGVNLYMKLVDEEGSLLAELEEETYVMLGKVD